MSCEHLNWVITDIRERGAGAHCIDCGTSGAMLPIWPDKINIDVQVSTQSKGLAFIDIDLQDLKPGEKMTIEKTDRGFRWMKLPIAILFALLLLGCGPQRTEDYGHSKPKDDRRFSYDCEIKWQMDLCVVTDHLTGKQYLVAKQVNTGMIKLDEFTPEEK